MDYLKTVKGMLANNISGEDLDSTREVILCNIRKSIEEGKLYWEQGSRKRKLDRVAMAYIPARLANTHSALRCTGNGNCMYNSCSILLIGSEELSEALRAAVTLEMYENEEYYATHPYIVEKVAENPERKLMIESMTVSLKANDSSNPIIAEAKRNVNDRSWGSLMTMFALSSVISQEITSVYPETCDLYSKVFNGTIKPRLPSKNNSQQPLCIMWSRVGDFEGSSGGFKPNHFVPLIVKTDETGKSQMQQRKDDPPPNIASPKPAKMMCLDGKGKDTPAAPRRQRGKVKSQSLKDMFPKIEKRTLSGSTNITETCQSTPMAEKTEEPEISDASSPSKQNNSGTITTSVLKDIDIFDVFEIKETLTAQQKIDLKEKLWKPSSKFCFPRAPDKLRCRLEWLDMYEMLMYSQSKDALFCFSCVVMGNRTRSKLTQKCGLRNWKAAATKLRQHFDKQH